VELVELGLGQHLLHAIQNKLKHTPRYLVLLTARNWWRDWHNQVGTERQPVPWELATIERNVLNLKSIMKSPPYRWFK
jgi:hypothetical protein